MRMLIRISNEMHSRVVGMSINGSLAGRWETAQDDFHLAMIQPETFRQLRRTFISQLIRSGSRIIWLCGLRIYRRHVTQSSLVSTKLKARVTHGDHFHLCVLSDLAWHLQLKLCYHRKAESFAMHSTL